MQGPATQQHDLYNTLTAIISDAIASVSLKFWLTGLPQADCILTVWNNQTAMAAAH